MGSYDTLTWYGELPDLPEGQKGFLLGFQTKSFPDRAQRILEVESDGILRVRTPKPEILISYEDYSEEMINEMSVALRELGERRVKGKPLPEKRYLRDIMCFSGEMRFYASFGKIGTGRIEYEATFDIGRLVDVHLANIRQPVPKPNHNNQMSQFVIHALGPSSDIDDPHKEEKNE